MGPDHGDRDRRRRQGRAQPRACHASARARIHNSTLRARPLEEKALTARAIERSVLPLLAAGAVARAWSPRPTRSSEAVAAYDRFAAGGKLGKIVLTMGG